MVTNAGRARPGPASTAPSSPAGPAALSSPAASATPSRAACDLVVLGCGSLRDGDQGAGPALIGELRASPVPPGVRLVDADGAGPDVAAPLRGARRVIVVDTASTGAAPGTVLRLPGSAGDDMPPLSGLHARSFRWEHALAFARWLLGPDFPADVTVYLIEAADSTPGGELSAPVRAGVHELLGLIRRDRAFRDAGR